MKASFLLPLLSLLLISCNNQKEYYIFLKTIKWFTIQDFTKEDQQDHTDTAEHTEEDFKK